MNLSRVISLSAVIVFLLTLAGCAGGGVEINTGPAATTTANVNPTKNRLLFQLIGPSLFRYQSKIDGQTNLAMLLKDKISL